MDYESLIKTLKAKPKRWLVTGCAGFIGSNLVEALLKMGQQVTGLDNFSTGYQHNLDQVQASVAPSEWEQFELITGDIRDMEVCRVACEKKDMVLHQAALGSVPRSITDPVTTNETNITGFLHILVAARDAGVKSFVYAASSSTYGDHPNLPKQEDIIGNPLSPYAVTKYVNELYAKVFSSTYGMRTSGLRYFNVFGPRQDPSGAYAAVIPLWFYALIRGKKVFINGDGETSRDFCYIDNCVQANLLAAMSRDDSLHQVYNIAFGQRTTLNELFHMIRTRVAKVFPGCEDVEPVYREFRPGDVRHSLADISRAKKILNYDPLYSVRQGLDLSAQWYLENLRDIG